MDTLFAKALELNLNLVLALDYDSIITWVQLRLLFDLMGNRPDIDALCPVQADLDGLVIGSLPGRRLTLDSWPVEIEMGHFGCTVIRVQALRKTPRPWFREQRLEERTGRAEASRCAEHREQEFRKPRSGLAPAPGLERSWRIGRHLLARSC